MTRRAALGTVVVLGVGAASPAAWAALQEGPAPDEVIEAHAARVISAEFDLSSSNRLEVVDPAGAVVLTADRPADGQLRLLLKTACPGDPGDTCDGGPVGPNGRWLVRQSGVGAVEEVPFFLRIGGAAPADVASSLEGRTATVSWAPAREPDVVGWDVGDGASTQRVTPEACNDTRCSTTFGYPGSQSGRRAFTVQAVRPTGVEQPAEVAGPAATSPPVTLPAPAPPPSAGPSGTGPRAGASSGPSAPPGPAGAATAQSFGQGFSSFSPSLGLPELPPPPQTTAPAVAGPQVADTFEPSLRYDDSLDAETGTSSDGDGDGDGNGDDDVAAPRGREGTLTSTGGLLGDEQLLRSLAGALVLLMSGAHLRTWLARAGPDDA